LIFYQECEGGEVNYTKGEWKVVPSNNSYVISNGTNYIARLFHSKAGFGVNSLAPKDNEVLANTHLISAAPDMYEALKAIGDLLFGLPENELIKQALAKAEGED
jgi:hypothetical protein